MKKFMPVIRTIATLGVAISVALPAAAESTPEAAIALAGQAVRSVSILYSPAELSTESGRAELYTSIKRAAREVCGPTGLREAGSLAMASRNRRCAEQAGSDAMAQVNSGRLASAEH